MKLTPEQMTRLRVALSATSEAVSAVGEFATALGDKSDLGLVFDSMADRMNFDFMLLVRLSDECPHHSVADGHCRYCGHVLDEGDEE